MIGCLCKYQRDLYLFRYLYPDPPLPRSRLWIPLIRNSQGRLNIHRQAGVSTTVAPSPRENKHAEYSSQCESHHPTDDRRSDGTHVSLGTAANVCGAFNIGGAVNVGGAAANGAGSGDGGDVAGDGDDAVALARDEYQSGEQQRAAQQW